MITKTKSWYSFVCRRAATTIQRFVRGDTVRFVRVDGVRRRRLLLASATLSIIPRALPCAVTSPGDTVLVAVRDTAINNDDLRLLTHCLHHSCNVILRGTDSVGSEKERKRS